MYQRFQNHYILFHVSDCLYAYLELYIHTPQTKQKQNKITLHLCINLYRTVEHYKTVIFIIKCNPLLYFSADK